MVRTVSVLLTASLCLPAYAANKPQVFDVPCTTLWPVVSDTIRNSGKYQPIAMDDTGMSATYKVGSAWSHATDVVVLKANAAGCQMVIDAPNRGLAYNDSRDLTERVKQGLANSTSNTQSGSTQGSILQSTQPTSGAGHGSLAQSMSASASSKKEKSSRSTAAQPAASGAGEQPVGPIQLAADMRIALTVNANCLKDPDPTGFFSNDFYSKCKADELNMVRNGIAASLGPGLVLAPGVSGPATYQLAVTLTKSVDRRSGISDFLSGKMQYEATYQLSDGAGSLVHSGTVAQEGSDSHPVDVEKQFAAKIAAVSAGFMSGKAASGSAATEHPVASQGVDAALQRAAEDATFEILARAYQSLNPKPMLPDETRLQKRKAEQAQENYDAKAAREAYIAGLKAANWWPEGMRGLALVLGSTGSPEAGIVWMRRYLEFVPDAADAAEMQAKINDWSKLAPPPPVPAGKLPAPVGMHIGFVCMDTPAIVALAKGQPDLEGALVSYVFSDTPADKAGLANGDIVLSYNGAVIHSAQEFITRAGKPAAGTRADIEVLRGTTKVALKIQF